MTSIRRLVASVPLVCVTPLLLAALSIGCKKTGGDQTETHAGAQSPTTASPGPASPNVVTSPATEELEATIERNNGYTEERNTADGRPVLSIGFREPPLKDADLEQLVPLLQKSSVPIALNLSRTGVTDAGVAKLKGIGNIQSLGLTETKISNDGLKNVGEMTQLEELYLSNDNLTDAGVAHLSKLTNLRKLSVYSKGVTDAAYASVEGMTQLEELHLGSGLGHLSDACLSHMKGLIHLKELHLASDDLTDAGMVYLKNLADVRTMWLEVPKVTAAGAANFSALKNLEELTVLSCPGLDDDGLKVLTGLKKLRVLDLVHIDPLTAKGSAALAQLTGLRKLRIGSVGADGLQGLKNLADLEELDLNFSRADDANLAYLSGLTKLRKLDVQDTAVTDAGMKSLVGLTGLRELWAQSNNITDDGLKQLAPLNSLEQLYLSNCKVTGTAFKDIRGMTGLKELFVDGDPIASANVLALKDLKGLTQVNLTGTKASEEAALELKHARPELRVRDITGNDVALDTKPPERPKVVMEDLSHTAPDFSLTAAAFFKEFSDSDADAKTKYKGKVIELSGEVGTTGRNISGDSNLSLKVPGDLLGVMCFTADEQPWATAVPGQKVKVKGKLSDYGATLLYCFFTDPGKYEAIALTAADLAREFTADPEAAAKKYQEKYLVLTGEVEKNEYNSAGAASVFLKTPDSKVSVSVSFTAFEMELVKSIKPNQKIKVVGQYTLNFGTDKVELHFCMPIK